jgi:hypothetical protein
MALWCSPTARLPSKRLSDRACRPARCISKATSITSKTSIIKVSTSNSDGFRPTREFQATSSSTNTQNRQPRRGQLAHTTGISSSLQQRSGVSVNRRNSRGRQRGRRRRQDMRRSGSFRCRRRKCSTTRKVKGKRQPQLCSKCDSISSD